MIKIEILSDLNGAPLGRTEHQEPDAKAAQEWAAHWTHEIIKGGFIPEGALVTYVLSTVPVFFTQVPEIVDIVTYKHAEMAEEGALAGAPDPEISTE